MKYITLVLIVFLSLGLTNSFSIYTVTYPTERTFSGGPSTISGTFSGTMSFWDGAFWTGQRTTCSNSSSTCYSFTPSIGSVTFTFYGLVGTLPLDSTTVSYYETYIKNDSLVTRFVGPYVP